MKTYPLLLCMIIATSVAHAGNQDYGKQTTKVVQPNQDGATRVLIEAFKKMPDLCESIYPQDLYGGASGACIDGATAALQNYLQGIKNPLFQAISGYCGNIQGVVGLNKSECAIGASTFAGLVQDQSQK